MPAGFYDFDSNSNRDRFDQEQFPPRQFIDGWKTGCWLMESVLQSSLQTFYNQTAFNQILACINSSVLSDHFTAMNASKKGHFSLNTTVDILVERLFLEEFVKIFNYSSYYSRCQPQFCQYTFNQQSEPLYIITSLLGLYGVVSVVLHLIIPYLVKFLLERTEQRTTLTVDQTHRNSKFYF